MTYIGGNTCETRRHLDGGRFRDAADYRILAGAGIEAVAAIEARLGPIPVVFITGIDVGPEARSLLVSGLSAKAVIDTRSAREAIAKIRNEADARAR